MLDLKNKYSVLLWRGSSLTYRNGEIIYLKSFKTSGCLYLTQNSLLGLYQAIYLSKAMSPVVI